jgi:hypothetical protein
MYLSFSSGVGVQFAQSDGPMPEEVSGTLLTNYYIIKPA